MDEPFYYFRAEDVIPRDAVYVVIGGSITVVESRLFEYHENVVRVEFQEGVEVIGAYAFSRCCCLTRVDCPTSLVAIGNRAFYECGQLSELILREGLAEIGSEAFFECRLERIAVPSSVVVIGAAAFALCKRLSEATLTEGLRWIGADAFSSCGLRRVAVPSSVVEIGVGAFTKSKRLSEVTLAGGMVMVARGAFFGCPRLERIAISSMAIVVEAGEDGNGRVACVAVTGGIERDPSLRVEEDEDEEDEDSEDEESEDEEDEDDEDEEPEPTKLILSSRYLPLMGQEDRTKFLDAIDQITGDQTRGAGALDLEDEGVANSIRDCFANCLAEYKTGVAAVLELALWKASMNQTRDASRARPAGGGKRARADAPTRYRCRITCGADVVIGSVLSYLWGPHRRADQEEDGGSIRL